MSPVRSQMDGTPMPWSSLSSSEWQSRPVVMPGWRANPTILTAVLAVALSALMGVAMVKLGTVQRELKAILIMAAC